MTATPSSAGRGDVHLAALLAELQPHGDPDLLRRTVLLLAAVRSEGGSCVPLAEWQGRALQPDDPPFPDLAAWRAALLVDGLGTTVTAQAAADSSPPKSPLVLDASDRLYLLRHFRAEQRIARQVRQRLAPAGPAAAVPPADWAALFPPPDQGPDWQAVAALAALRSRFAVITGGPGTGKTTTVARLLALLLRTAPDLRIALCAPTGKAAARLDESLQGQLPQLLADDRRGRVPAATTVHRLLGYLPHADAFRFGPDRPLPADLVLVDEASMVDLLLMDALLAAVPPTARVVLLGDRDQLSSVAPGQVLGDLCRAARPERGAGPGLAAAYRQQTGIALPAQDGALADSVVLLRQNYRFAGQGLGAFARALAGRDAAGALAALQAGGEDLGWLPPTTLAAALAPALPHAQELLRAPDPATALARLGHFRVLCATRQGPFGVEACNRALHAAMQPHGRSADGPWFRGRPVLVTQNDPFTRLYNGDVGLCWPDPQGRMMVWFGQGDRLRAVAPIAMPACETAFAMTVHKAQGSEFQEVLLLLPDQDGPLCNAALVYTAVTRARRRAQVCGDGAILRAALDRWPERSSGLGDLLAAGPD